MANVITFEMRIRGTKENCNKMLNSELNCYEWFVVAENGTSEDYMLYTEGECRWSVTGSLIDTDDDHTIATKAKDFNLEIEVVGYDKSEPEWIEHYHYKGTQCLRAYALVPYMQSWDLDESDLSDEDKQKYDFIEAHDVYVLKSQYAEKFKWDDENYIMIVDYIMSFDDLNN